MAWENRIEGTFDFYYNLDINKKSSAPASKIHLDEHGLKMKMFGIFTAFALRISLVYTTFENHHQ